MEDFNAMNVPDDIKEQKIIYKKLITNAISDLDRNKLEHLAAFFNEAIDHCNAAIELVIDIDRS